MAGDPIILSAEIDPVDLIVEIAGVDSALAARVTIETQNGGPLQLHVGDEDLTSGERDTIERRIRGLGSAAVRNRAALRDLRRERDRRLAMSDWTQLADVPPETRDLWVPYRQALRDLPAMTSDPTSVVWPEPPGELEQAVAP